LVDEIVVGVIHFTEDGIVLGGSTMRTSARQEQGRRRGIILVLILGVLALMAVIGVTFATFSGQSRISARNAAQAVIVPQRDELFDYALSQLICDTPDIRSAIRGHSMARDMYGNDAFGNGYLASRPGGQGASPYNYSTFYITGVNPGVGTLYLLTTNIRSDDSAFYGYNFTRWIIRVHGVLTTPANDGVGMGTGLVDQTLEVLNDDTSGTYRVFTVNIGTSDGYYSTSPPPVLPTTLLNPTGGYVTQLPGEYLVKAVGGTLTNTFSFILDGRWLRAFNGPGMTAGAVHANFRYNGTFQGLTSWDGQPNLIGMDEDYDAADLENWFLAMQSADGSVMIPSFHRPAAIRVDTANTTNDWSRTAGTTYDMSRILRPVAADGHDAATFPDLLPDSHGRLTYDVDNDGDGQSDSVWLDLGYPARRNAQGILYKPLFAFMVIGLNGRIPLNTAGNLAGNISGVGGGPTHAAHLGNSVSEVDPTYGLQNAFVSSALANDSTFAFTPLAATAGPGTPTPYTIGLPGLTGFLNGQVDSGNVDVRLTQLRNLLAGTRPQNSPVPDPNANPSGFPQTSTNYPMTTDQTGMANGDDNFVAFNNNQVYFLPNGLADAADIDGYPNAVVRKTQPVPGRWGEAQAVPGYPVVPNPNPPPAYFNLVTANYNNLVRAGFSLDPSDYNNGTPRDAADDNYNSFDPFPTGHTGEVGDNDFLDAAGAFLFPVERMRRYVAPADINGAGRIVSYDGANSQAGLDLGSDQWGRVEFSNYFRPPGLPGQVTPGAGTTAVMFPWSLSQPYPTTLVTNVTTGALAGNQLLNSNPLHGFEAQRYPNLNYPPPSIPPGFSPQSVGGAPIDLPAGTPPPTPPPLPILPTTLPTYDVSANGEVSSDGLDEADEMNLYQPNAQVDAPFGYSDLEWLYRLQDVDGKALNSRLAQLAPISFINTIDGQRRRRLYSIDSWDLNNYAWTNDNPTTQTAPNGFQNNARFIPQADAGFTTLNVTSVPPPAVAPANPFIAGVFNPTAPAPSPTPALAHRDKKINLNYPLPVSNDPNEPIRQKWITDTYNTLKSILPPLAVDSPEELAQLSQYVINIVDFRDPDCTMTHWTNPDVLLRPGTVGASPFVLLANSPSKLATDLPLDQYGIEYCPIAINEVMAYSFQNNGTTPPQINRFFIELVNTLTSPELGTVTPAAPGLGTPQNNASVLDLAGFQSSGAANPWAGGCWDIILTGDDPASRPDPITGQLWGTGSTFYGLIPLTQAAFTGAATDPVIYPLPQAPDVSYASYSPTSGTPPPPPPPGIVPITYFLGDSTKTPTTYSTLPATPYFLTIGNPPPPSGASETYPYAPTLTLSTTYDPVAGTPPTKAPPQGVLPPFSAAPTTYPANIPAPPVSKGTGTYYWVCLRRPANPFAGVSQNNPMIVVDCMRFPYIESGGSSSTPGTNFMYSNQRLQPFRGGHAVPMPGATGALDPRYGYTEQIAVPTNTYVPPTSTTNKDFCMYGGAKINSNPLYHTLGYPNDGTLFTGSVTGGLFNAPYLNEPWDYFPFNDRDFTSVAELLMVPGCPPGLFTKQFTELAPSANNVTNVFSQVTPLTTLPATKIQLPAFPATASSYLNAVYTSTTAPTAIATPPLPPHTFPYLIDKFFYTGASPATLPTTSTFGDPTGDGWFKMFEFFEVPSQMIGAIGPVAQGTDFDWLRQDLKPGLINLNLIIDEEVFFSVFGSQDQSFNQQLLSFDQLPGTTFTGGAWTNPTALTAGTSPLPLVVTATLSSGEPAYAYPMNNVGVVAYDRLNKTFDSRMKASFAQFLSLRHGGSGFIFGYGSGWTGQNFTVQAGYPTVAGNTYAIPADRPFHSLSYPDIDYTVMRPAALPPSTYTDPPLPTTPPAPAWPPTGYTGNYVGDPGVRNPSLYQGFVTNVSVSPPNAPGINPNSKPASQLLVPPAIPVRRLFQPPDAIPPGTTPPAPANPVSNAGESGDPYIDNLKPTSASVATGALPLFGAYSINDGFVNLFWVPSGVSPSSPPAPVSPPSPVSTTPNPYLGSNSVSANSVAPPTPPATTPASTPPLYDTKQHPYFRTEMLQKVMNLTTVRTHQFAVWITVGFFEVKRQGDLLMLQQTNANPVLAFDLLGPELGAATGQTTRYRGFFIVDRLKLYGFDDKTPGSFRPAVVYRQMIE
jgi:hypothetical protein